MRARHVVGGALRHAVKRILRFRRYSSSMWSGDYADWASAADRCAGYAAQGILNSCLFALHQVQAGKAAYERDSILYNDSRYCWELLTVAYRTAARHQGHLSMLDFGGALGSLYYQHRRWLDEIPSVEWHVVEQRNFVDCGREEASDGRLRFFYDLAESTAISHPNVVLLSGVLQALEEPRAWIATFNALDVPYIVLDRIPVTTGPDMLTVQHVPPHIYDASYPAWFFNESQFLADFSNFRVIGTSHSQYDSDVWVNGRQCTFRGYILQRQP